MSTDGPDTERLANVLGAVMSRYLDAKNQQDKDTERKDRTDADRGVLPSVDRGPS